MNRTTRAFAGSGLAALLAAALLHLLVVLDVPGAWAAMVHLMLFGWITGIIFAVNYHVLPVFSARRFPHPRLIAAHWWLFTVGVALATACLIVPSNAGFTAGVVLEIGAALTFVANTILLFTRGERQAQRSPMPPIADQPRVDRLGTSATKSAGLLLPLALLLLLAQQVGWIDGEWRLAAEHLTTLGWIMLMIVGVAYHVLPRFSGRGVRGVAWARAQLLCHRAALALIVPALGCGWPRLFAVGGLLMTAALGLFAWTIWPTLSAVRPRSSPIKVTLKERPR